MERVKTWVILGGAAMGSVLAGFAIGYNTKRVTIPVFLAGPGIILQVNKAEQTVTCYRKEDVWKK